MSSHSSKSIEWRLVQICAMLPFHFWHETWYPNFATWPLAIVDCIFLLEFSRNDTPSRIKIDLIFVIMARKIPNASMLLDGSKKKSAFAFWTVLFIFWNNFYFCFVCLWRLLFRLQRRRFTVIVIAIQILNIAKTIRIAEIAGSPRFSRSDIFPCETHKMKYCIVVCKQYYLNSIRTAWWWCEYSEEYTWTKCQKLAEKGQTN